MAQSSDNDKLKHCISFILESFHGKSSSGTSRSPLFVGLNGAQGSGKTTLVLDIARTLRQPPYCFPIAAFSIDDLYLTHEAQAKLAATHPDNPLIQHRGQPSTHDLPLAISLFSDLRNAVETRLPYFDKSAYHGQGDRTPKECWEIVNRSGHLATKVAIIEGWCVGFRALSKQALRQKWEAAMKRREDGSYSGRLGYNRFEDVEFVNDALTAYDQLTDRLDILIHLDAANPQNVYRWREEQERALRGAKGSGMTTEQVKSFVDGYYPAYELYNEKLKAGAFESSSSRQLRLTVGQDRQIEEVTRV